MMYCSDARKEIIELIIYWRSIGESPQYRLSKILTKDLQFLNATDTEKRFLIAIHEKLGVSQWPNIYKLFTETALSLPGASNEYDRMIEVRKEAERKQLLVIRKIELEEEERRRKIDERKKKEEEKKQLLEIRKGELEEAERRRRIDEREKREAAEIEKRQRLYEKIELLFEDDFLASKQISLNKLSPLVSEDEFKEFSAQFVISWFDRQGWPKPDQEQAMAIAEVWDDVQVIARAGSGKTSTIVNRAAFLVKHCKISPTEILLLAFNKEAAKEIENRLAKKLGEKAPQAMTFHALAYALVHPEETLIYDDENTGFKKSATVQQVIDSFIRDSKWAKTIQSLMMKYFRSSWDEIENTGSHLSKEDMLEYRRSLPYLGLDGIYYKSKSEKKIADYLFEHNIPYKYERNFFWGGRNYKPDFTIPLSGNIKGVIIEYFGLAGDSEYDQQVEEKREFWKNKTDYGFIELFPNEKGSVDENDLKNAIANELNEKYGLAINKLTELEIWHRIKDRAVDEFSKTVARFISLCRIKKLTPENLTYKVEEIHSQLNRIADDNRSILELQLEFLEIAQEIYQEYSRTLSMKDEEDFEGLLIKATKVIRDGQCDWNRKSGSGNLSNIKYLFIDEYQDFSLLFYELVDSIRYINGQAKVFCVGDDWQAINGFAGSDLRYFNDFKDYFNNAKDLIISSNYRSAKGIVDIGNRFMYGKGTPSKSVSNDLGDVQVAWVEDFKPSDMENAFYPGDVITPILIRLVYSYIQKGQRVALLFRRGNGLQWYTPYEGIKGSYHKEFITAIRSALPKDLRSMVVAMDTTHSYKGKEEDAIIIVDAVRRSYPLLHPSNIFFEVLGQSTDEIIQEEKRLFYVAISRAKKSLIIVSEHKEKSPFLNNILYPLASICFEKLPAPPREGKDCRITVSNHPRNQGGGTYPIRECLRLNDYSWNANKRSWIKNVPAKEFAKEDLLKEPWVQEAKNVVITVIDEFEKTLHQIEIDDKGLV